MTEITWLHIADLHFRSRESLDEHNRQIVLEALWEDIERQIKTLGKPDFIVFTGDIAYYGKKSEYEAVKQHFLVPLLANTGVPKNRLFIVPGNHDVNWKEIDEPRQAAMRGLITEDSTRTRDAIYKFLSNSEDLPHYFRPQKDFWTFFRDFMGDILPIDSDTYYYTFEFSCKGYNLGILGLNSAWMSGYFKDDQGKVQDQGNLFLSELQVSQAIKRTKDATLRIALLHHPLEWISDFDNNSVRLLQRNCPIVLRGHLHRAEIEKKSLFAGDVTVVPAGAIYESRDGHNGYQFVVLNLRTGKGRVHFRCYNERGPEGPEWVSDVMITGDEYKGVFPFKIPPIKKSTTKDKSILPDCVPVVVITMSAAEARLFFEENQDHLELKGLDTNTILQQYNSTRSSWRPFGPQNGTIEEILRGFVKKREFSRGETKFKVEFEFYTEEFFSDDPLVRDGVFKNLKTEGCLFIIDGLALLNDKIRSRLQGTIGGAKTLAFFVITPIDPLQSILNVQLSKIAESSFSIFSHDYKNELSPHSSLYIGNQVELQRHIRNSLQELDLPTRWTPYWEQAYEQQGIVSHGYKDVLTP